MCLRVSWPAVSLGWGGVGSVAVVGVGRGHRRFSRLPFVLMKTNVAVGQRLYAL